MWELCSSLKWNKKKALSKLITICGFQKLKGLFNPGPLCGHTHHNALTGNLKASDNIQGGHPLTKKTFFRSQQCQYSVPLDISCPRCFTQWVGIIIRGIVDFGVEFHYSSSGEEEGRSGHQLNAILLTIQNQGFGVKKCVFNKCTIKVCVSCCWRCPPRLARHTWPCPCISVVPEATHKVSLGSMKGAVSAQKALQGSETETWE